MSVDAAARVRAALEAADIRLERIDADAAAVVLSAVEADLWSFEALAREAGEAPSIEIAVAEFQATETKATKPPAIEHMDVAFAAVESGPSGPPSTATARGTTDMVIDRGVAALAEAVRAGSVSANTVVEAVLNRIAMIEPVLHAYSEVFVEDARAAATGLDQRRTGGEELGPLAGVPIAVKDVFDVAGHATRAGSRAYHDAVATEDSAVVARAKAAGAIIIGHTVSHELGYGANVPPTRNAIDQDRFPGSSSSGSAVAVAAGSAVAAIGGDSGGSVRVPAALNGIFGLKPTRGALSAAGSVPMTPALDTVGVMARSISDLALLWRVLSGRNGTADASAGVVRIGWVESDTAIDPAVDAILREGIAGAERILDVETVRLPHPGIFRAVGTALVVSDTAHTHERVLRERAELIDSRTRPMLAAGWGVSTSARELAERLLPVAAADIDGLFADGRLDAIALPGFPFVPGPPDDFAGHVDPAILALTHDQQMLANVSGRPALTIPFGRLPDGFPVGLQLVGRPDSEEVLFELGARLERSTTQNRGAP